ncbi:MAG: hypothetical protein J2P43_16390 [Candidatus Dormibacteraeota bacterium]|nr:hypothetical protein [Candidatus Dormibacteraeota bacterium]MBO0746600.1 hypothetical protein [Candidatus Dormibacteraeota bacterium]
MIDDVIARLEAPDVQLSGGTGVGAVRSAFDAGAVDQVIIGGGLDLGVRLEVVREVFQSSQSTTVHMNSPSGPASFLPFVRAVITGFVGRE